MFRCPLTLPRFGSRRTGRTTLVALAAATLATLWAAGRGLVRVEVSGTSMLPSLHPGDRLIVVRVPGVDQPWPPLGSVVAVRDPREPARVLVKRVAGLDRRANTIEVLGDAAGASTDSRTFGPLPRSALVGRAVYRYAPRGRSGRVPWPAEYHRRDAEPP